MANIETSSAAPATTTSRWQRADPKPCSSTSAAARTPLTLDHRANTGTVGNVGTLIGGTGGDTITLGTAASNASIDLGAGSDTLTFSNFANTATVANADTITGGSGNNTITLGSALTTTMQVDLGAGANKLTLATSPTPARSATSIR